MKIGYARVSTQDQKLELQISELEKYGCEIFKEKKSAVKERPELDKLLAHMRSGDVVVVWKLDRLGRSLKHLQTSQLLAQAIHNARWSSNARLYIKKRIN